MMRADHVLGLVIGVVIALLVIGGGAYLLGYNAGYSAGERCVATLGTSCR